MSKLETLKDVLEDELKDLYSAENQLIKALPKMEKKANNAELKKALANHLKETKGQVERLEKIGEKLDMNLSGKKCKAMEGLIKEGDEVIAEDSDNEALIDSLLIGCAQRVEHYEIAAYGTAIAMAEELKEDEVASLLQETLDEESNADETLSSISVEKVLPQAQAAM